MTTRSSEEAICSRPGNICRTCSEPAGNIFSASHDWCWKSQSFSRWHSSHLASYSTYSICIITPSPLSGMRYGRNFQNGIGRYWRPQRISSMLPDTGEDIQVKEMHSAQGKQHPAQLVTQQFNRSEERRVGKECRSRWSPDH